MFTLCTILIKKRNNADKTTDHTVRLWEVVTDSVIKVQ